MCLIKLNNFHFVCLWMQDMLMQLAKAVANAAAALVLKAKNVAQKTEDSAQQNRVIAAATQCALSTSQLVACTRVSVRTWFIHRQNNRFYLMLKCAFYLCDRWWLLPSAHPCVRSSSSRLGSWWLSLLRAVWRRRRGRPMTSSCSNRWAWLPQVSLRLSMSCYSILDSTPVEDSQSDDTERLPTASWMWRTTSSAPWETQVLGMCFFFSSLSGRISLP